MSSHPKKKTPKLYGKILNINPKYYQQIPIKVTIHSPNHFSSSRTSSQINIGNFNKTINFSSSSHHRLNSDSKLIKQIHSLNIIHTENKNTNETKYDDLIEFTFNSLGIEECYLETLNKNKINFDDLLFLTREDLKEMNIPIGPRNRILNFISQFSNYKSINGIVTKEAIKSFFLNSKSIFNLRKLYFPYSNSSKNEITLSKEKPIVTSPTISQRNHKNENSLPSSAKKSNLKQMQLKPIAKIKNNNVKNIKGNIMTKEFKDIKKIKEKLKQQLTLYKLSNKK